MRFVNALDYTFASMIDLMIDFFVFVGPLAWALLISSKWVLVVGVGCFVLALLWVESVLASVLSKGPIFVSVIFFLAFVLIVL